MADLPERLLCIDKTCTGTINEKGYCNVCGKSLDENHDPLRVEQEVDAKNHSALTEFQLECERLLAERLAQVGNSISNRTLMFPERWKPAVLWREIEKERPYITGSIEGTDIEFTIYGSGADFNSSHGGQEFMVPAGVSLVGIPEEFVDAVLETIQKEKAKINPGHP